MYIKVDVVNAVLDSQTVALALGSISPSQTFGVSLGDFFCRCVPVRINPGRHTNCLWRMFVEKRMVLHHWVMSDNEEILVLLYFGHHIPKAARGKQRRTLGPSRIVDAAVGVFQVG
jgi:hypothetical protein